jgi:methylmalonyl-CoA mutase cobalamin-binding subunit
MSPSVNPTPSSTAPLPSVAVPPPAVAPTRTPRVTVIDDFSTNQNGFQHGTQVVNTILNKAGGAVQVDRRNVAGQGTTGIRNALQDIANQARTGNKPTDVVNISMFSAQNNADTQAIRQLVNELEGQGIKVVVAAGNNGPNQPNQLAIGTRALVVANGTNISGPGNTVGNGQTTSFATADTTGNLLRQMLSSGVV